MSAYDFERQESRDARDYPDDDGFTPDLVCHRGEWMPAEVADELRAEERRERGWRR